MHIDQSWPSHLVGDDVRRSLRIVLRSRDVRKRRRDKETPSGRRRRKGGTPGGRGEDAAHDHVPPRLAVGRLHG